MTHLRSQVTVRDKVERYVTLSQLLAINCVVNITRNRRKKSLGNPAHSSYFRSLNVVFATRNVLILFIKFIMFRILRCKQIS